MASDAVKIALTGPDGDIETLWANPTGAPDEYILDNAPWYAYGVSAEDTIEARADETGYLHMTKVVRKSGNRTLRVILELTEPARIWTFESQSLVNTLKERGCDIDNMNSDLIAVTIPSGIDLLSIGSLIDSAGFDFEYSDPTYEELFPADPSDVDAPEV